MLNGLTRLVDIDRKCVSCGNQFVVKRPVSENGKLLNALEQQLSTRCDECRRPSSMSGKEWAHCRLPRSKHICVICGQEFSGRKRLYCNPMCSREGARRREAERVREYQCTCIRCNKTFTTRFLRAKYCSSACERAAKRKRIDERRAAQGILPTQVDIKLPTSRHLKGAIAESLFDAWCMQNGIACFRSVCDCMSAIDRVVYANGKWNAVQVKSCHDETKRVDFAHSGLYNGVDWLCCIDCITGQIVVYEADEAVLNTSVRMPLIG